MVVFIPTRLAPPIVALLLVTPWDGVEKKKKNKIIIIIIIKYMFFYTIFPRTGLALKKTVEAK